MDGTSTTAGAASSAEALAIIPTYEEVLNIEALIRRVHRAAPRVDVLVVDDASPDGTAERVAALAGADGRVHLLRRPGKLGMGTAYVDGFRWAWERGYERVAQLDADHSHDPSSLPSLLAGLDGADLVIGSRAVEGGGVEGWGAHRQALSRAGSAYCRLWLGWGLSDPTSGFRALRRRALRVLLERPPRSEGFSFQIEVAYRVREAGLRVVERPIVFHERRRGRSKLDGLIVAEALAVVPLLRACRAVGRL